jgi:hypothetical protein
MLNRFKPLITGIFLFALTFATAAHGQEQPSPQQQELMDQMRQNMQTVFQNMRDKGINPQDIFTPGMDPSEMQKVLVDKGVIDAQTAAQMQATMQKLTTMRLRDQLQCSDAEYAIMEPLIQKVIAAQNAVGANGGMRMMGGLVATPSPAAADVNKARKALHAAIADPNTTPDQFVSLLKDLRDAQAKAKDELTAARQELVTVLNVRQEAALAQMGILE